MQRANEEQLELFADLLEPASEIIGDGEIAAVLKPGGGKLLNAFKLALKNHKNAVIQIGQFFWHFCSLCFFVRKNMTFPQDFSCF